MQVGGGEKGEPDRSRARESGSRPCSGSTWQWPPLSPPLHARPSSLHGADAVIPILQVRKLRPGKQETFPEGQRMASKQQSWTSACLPTWVASLCPPTLCSEQAGVLIEVPCQAGPHSSHLQLGMMSSLQV